MQRALEALAWTVVLASCERISKFEGVRRDVTPRAVSETKDVVADVAAMAADTQPPPSITPPILAPAQTPALADAKDTVQIATTAELGELGALVVPVQGVTHSQLRDTYTEARGSRVHEAIDILAPRGTPVISATEGRLLKLFNSKAGGLMVYATDASERFILLYGHLDRYADGLSNGMRLERGQVIGYVGTTGNAPPGTPHLHFGILRGDPQRSWSSGVAVNPYVLLKRNGV